MPFSNESLFSDVNILILVCKSVPSCRTDMAARYAIAYHRVERVGKRKREDRITQRGPLATGRRQWHLTKVWNFQPSAKLTPALQHWWWVGKYAKSVTSRDFCLPGTEVGLSCCWLFNVPANMLVCTVGMDLHRLCTRCHRETEFADPTYNLTQ